MSTSAYSDLEKCDGFSWDEGNQDKNWATHGVSDGECEEIFFNDPLIVGSDAGHSKQERRYYALGQTNGERQLFVAFAIRKQRIRVISARGMTRREMRKYKS